LLHKLTITALFLSDGYYQILPIFWLGFFTNFFMNYNQILVSLIMENSSHVFVFSRLTLLNERTRNVSIRNVVYCGSP